MSQTAPPPDPDAPRPLPRRALPRPRPPARTARASRRSTPSGWSLWPRSRWRCPPTGSGSGARTGRRVAVRRRGRSPPCICSAGGRGTGRRAWARACWRRPASRSFPAAAYSPQSAAFTLLTVAALFAFVAGSSLAALALAAGAALVRPDGLLLGLLLLGLALAQQRKRAVYGAAVFLVPLLAVWSGRIASGHGLPPLPAFGFHPGRCSGCGHPPPPCCSGCCCRSARR